MLLVMALAYVIGRTFGKSIGAYIGSRISDAPEGVRKYMPFCLLSQAGVSIGLSIQAGTDYPGVMGQQIMLIITATTFIVQLIGPICVRHAVIKSGEAGLDIDAGDLKRQAKVGDITVGGIKIASSDSASIVSESTTVSQLAEQFSQTPNINYVVRDDKGKLSGVIPIDNLKEALYLTDLRDAMLAEDIMDQPNCCCTPDDTLNDIETMFAEKGVDAVPIVDKDGSSLGIIERAALDHYIHGRVMEAQLASEKLG
jgi:CBS domain-containing protein